MAGRRADVYEFWLDRIQTAKERLGREQKESQWAEWARYSAMENTRRFHFSEASLRDIKLDIVGERPALKIEAKLGKDILLEPALQRLAEVELDRPQNWEAIGRVVDDVSLAGIGWLAADWVGPVMPEPGLSEQEEAAQIMLARQHLQALLTGMRVPVSDTDAHEIHLEIESQALAEFGLDPMIRNLLKAHLEEHEAWLPSRAPTYFRLRRVYPGSILYDDTADEFQYADWVAERSVERLEDIQANQELKNTANLTGRAEIRRRGYRKRSDRPSLRTGGIPGWANYNAMIGHHPEDQLYEVVWRIHDIRENRLIVITEDHPDRKPLLEDEYTYPGVAYYPLVFERDPDNVEGVSDYQKIIHPANVRNEIHQTWIKHLARHAVRKILYTTGFLDSQGEAQLADPNRPNVKVKSLEGYRVLDPVAITPDAYRIDTVMQDNINRMLGAADVHQGIGGQAGTATEATMLDATRGRVVRYRRRQVAGMIRWALERMFAYYRSFGSEKLFLRRGLSPNRDLVLDPDDIPEELWIIVDTDTLSAINQDLDRQLSRQAVEIITASPWMMEGLGTAGRREVLARFLRAQRIVREPEQILEEAEAERRDQMMMMQQAARMEQGPGIEGMGGQASGSALAGVQPSMPAADMGGNGGVGFNGPRIMGGGRVRPPGQS